MKLILPQAHHLVSLYSKQSTILPAKFKWAIDRDRGRGGEGELYQQTRTPKRYYQCGRHRRVGSAMMGSGKTRVSIANRRSIRGVRRKKKLP